MTTRSGRCRMLIEMGLEIFMVAGCMGFTQVRFRGRCWRPCADASRVGYEFRPPVVVGSPRANELSGQVVGLAVGTRAGFRLPLPREWLQILLAPGSGLASRGN